jgi:hypothetical protein
LQALSSAVEYRANLVAPLLPLLLLGRTSFLVPKLSERKKENAREVEGRAL